LVAYLLKIIDSFMDAHLKYMFSSVNFKGSRSNVFIEDSFYTEYKDKYGNVIGADKKDEDIVNEKSTVTAHDEYPFKNQRPKTEEVRDAAGDYVDSQSIILTLLTLYDLMDKILKTIEQIEEQIKKLIKLLKNLVDNTIESVKEIPKNINDLIHDIAEGFKQLNDYRFWARKYTSRRWYVK
jgi:gas vesicle protein